MTVRSVRVAALLLAAAAAACSRGGGSRNDAGAGPGPATRYAVGGTATGLAGAIVLQDNGADDLALSSDGAFTFATSLADGAAYAVTVKDHPAGQRCTVANGRGSISGAPVTDVAVACTSYFRVAAQVTGLQGTLVLQDNGGDDLSVMADGTVAFATSIAAGGGYEVTVTTQPAGQRCTVTGGSGTISGANVLATVTCVSFYRVGGTVTGLAGAGLVLQDNGGDDLAVAADGAFTFATSIAGGGAYAVTILHQPAPQDCTVTHGGGTIHGDVSDVLVTCHGWDPIQVVTSIGGAANYPDFAFAPNGDAVAVWREVGTTTDTWGNKIPEIRTGRFSVATRTFGASERLDGATAITSAVRLPASVAVDGAGSAFAAWQQVDAGGSIHVLGARQAAGGSWTSLGQADTAGSVDATEQRVAIDPAGNALLVWRQPAFSMSSTAYPWARGYTPGTGWDAAPERLQSASAGVEDPRVAFDGAGTTFAVWWDTSNNVSVMAAVKPAAGVWGAPLPLEVSKGATDYASAAELAVNAAGDAVVVFAQYDGSGARSLFARRFDGQLGSWSGPMLLEASGGINDRRSPAVAMDAAGNAVAVWRIYGTSDVHASRYDVGTGTWSAPVILGTDTTEPPFRATSVAVDPATGDAIAIWNWGSGSYLRAARYVAGQGWQAAVDLLVSAGGVRDPLVRIDASGRSLLLFTRPLGGVDRLFHTSFR